MAKHVLARPSRGGDNPAERSLDSMCLLPTLPGETVQAFVHRCTDTARPLTARNTLRLTLLAVLGEAGFPPDSPARAAQLFLHKPVPEAMREPAPVIHSAPAAVQ